MTKLVGILNLTPDSFSDGGRYSDATAQMRALERLIDDGADVVDIGAESTRPGATPLSANEEWERLRPLFSLLSRKALPIELSLDTRHAQNAKRALDIGFHWINDVSGFTQSEMIGTVGGYHCTLVVMHSLSVPADKNIVLPEGADVIKTLGAFADERMEKLEHAGIKKARIIFDPGLGFGKTAAQSWEIITRIDELKALGLPLLIGHSRKSFLAQAGQDPNQATLELSRKLIQKNIDYLRVHDVASHRALL